MSSENVYEVTDYIRGWYQDQEQYHCLYCSQTFKEGLIYPYETLQQTAQHAIQQHVTTVHGGAFQGLLSLGRTASGLSEMQQEILTLFGQNLKDPAIAQRLGVSTSTIRNYRFKLREKERQARVFTSLMTLLETTPCLPPHQGATMLDDRYQITAEERQRVLATYLDADGFVQQFPSKEKRKIIILSEFSQDFDPQKNYSEKAVNDILKRRIADFATVRRYLIEYGFLKRTKDGQTYWRS
ncbi:transcriptional regulator [Enterococcus canis]|uniref:Transcriptional regulator n=1 Tax=Enterococcus canis TaxID=214095 RepID=A0A1L8RCM7_9ENTE|nr:DUF2087 domain-containing protein [Enterococcus canis]OJG17485.1 transcriptional regulator [Enterococcus canis]